MYETDITKASIVVTRVIERDAHQQHILSHTEEKRFGVKLQTRL